MLRFAFDMIVSNLKKYILSVLLMSISLLLIMFSLLIYKGEQYSYISCNDALNKGIDGTAVLRLDENSFIYNQEVKTFLKEAFESKEPVLIDYIIDMDKKAFPMVAPGAPIDNIITEEDFEK